MLGAPADALAVSCAGLQAALTNSSPGDTMGIDESSCRGHWDLPAHQITLQGNGAGVTLDGDTDEDGVGDVQILHGEDVGATVIRNLTFRNGHAADDPDTFALGNGGAINLEGNSPVTIENVSFYDNEATDVGGAVHVTNTGTGDTPVTIRESVFGAPPPRSAGYSTRRRRRP